MGIEERREVMRQVEFSGDSGRNDAPKRPQEMDAAAHLIREKGYAPERFGFGPGVDVQGYSPFGIGLAELQGTIGLVEDLESAESWEPKMPSDIEHDARLWPEECSKSPRWEEREEQMAIEDGMAPVEGTGLLEGEEEFTPALTPEEELTGHEYGTVSHVAMEPMPAPFDVDQPEPELEIAEEGELAAQSVPQLLPEPGAEIIEAMKSEHIDEKKEIGVET
ncbi:MAG TPA: hypothetical protein PLU15_10970, partial [Bacillota bacterium]|nr:hypothetical protein [Bacillota bacterium]